MPSPFDVGDAQRELAYQIRRQHFGMEERPFNSTARDRQYGSAVARSPFLSLVANPARQNDPFPDLPPESKWTPEQVQAMAELPKHHRAMVMMRHPEKYGSMDREQRREFMGIEPVRDPFVNKILEGKLTMAATPGGLNEMIAAESVAKKAGELSMPQTAATKAGLDIRQYWGGDTDAYQQWRDEYVRTGKKTASQTYAKEGVPNVTVADLTSIKGKREAEQLLADKYEPIGMLGRREEGGPGAFPLTTASRTEMLRDVSAAAKTRDRMIGISSQFNADYQKLRSKLDKNLIGFRSNMEGIIPGWIPVVGGRNPTPEEFRKVNEMRVQSQQIAMNFSEEAHELYGAALTAVELPRAKAALPHQDMNAVELQAALDVSMQVANYITAKWAVFEELRGEPNGPQGPHEMDMIDVAQHLDKISYAQYQQILTAEPNVDKRNAAMRAKRIVEDSYNLTPGTYDSVVSGALEWLQEVEAQAGG